MDTNQQTCTGHAVDRDLLVDQIRSADRDPREDELDALLRLLKLARNDSGQSSRVAKFLLAWWNPRTCGGFDVIDVGTLDAELSADVVVVFGIIARIRLFPTDLSDEFTAGFRELVAIWHRRFSKRRRLVGPGSSL